MKAKAELISGAISRKRAARLVRMTVDDSSLSIAFATREADREPRIWRQETYAAIGRWY